MSLVDERSDDIVVISSEAVKTMNEVDHSSGISNRSIVRAPVCDIEKKLLILDINGLLADIVSPPPKGLASDKRIAGRAIFKRPFYLDFLKFCFEHFEDLSHCTATGFRTIENRHKTLVFKELRRIWEKHDPSLPWEKGIYNESNTLLLDDSPYKALLNPAHTAVFPHPYTFQRGSDTSLGNVILRNVYRAPQGSPQLSGPGGDLRVYLEGLAAAENIQEFIEQEPFGQSPINESSASWPFYLRVLSTVYSVDTTNVTNMTCNSSVLR
ncbi:Haloacid dehalogenase-like hydrolase superfamily protein [Prunus dulcis]|uniref:Mitochondrial import inner membrane translocase subunit TIM50 n=1 Tax=Prunus dulcis TaxID=3755 RepID=A0A4Y1R7R2_PRUDU|nr:Haloacid dehalogenase-like hydrolase superfamily protein [Prunus dulcis]